MQYWYAYRFVSKPVGSGGGRAVGERQYLFVNGRCGSGMGACVCLTWGMGLTDNV